MNDRPNLFFIFPGAVYDPDEDFGTRLKYLSKHFSGMVTTWGDRKFVKKIGDFSINIFTQPKFLKGPLKSAFFFVKSVQIASEYSTHNNGIDLVIAYDPLKSGLTGLAVSYLFKANFVCEVNGDYTSDSLYVNINNRLIRKLKKYSILAVERFVLSHADGIKYLFPEQLDFFGKYIKNAKLLQYPDFIDLEPFKNLGEAKEVLLVGFPFYVKGVDILIAAFKKISNSFPDWSLTILGHYPDQSLLNKHIDGHPRIRHHLPVPHSEIPDYIGRCGIFCLASRTEAMGRVLLEAMAAAKPRVASRVGGVHTVVEDQVDGFLFEPENIDQLAQILYKLMGDPQLRNRIGEAGRQRAKREFSGSLYLNAIHPFYIRTMK